MNFVQWLIKKKYFDNYISSIVKILRTFFNYLLNELYLPIGNFHNQFKIQTHPIPVVVLEPHQIKYLISNEDFRCKLTPKLKKLNDIFIFGCTIGLRYKDLMRLKVTDIQNTENGSFVILNTSKTATQVKIPLPDYALSIIDKYKRRSKTLILPQISNVNLNIGLKKLIEKAGWVYNYPKIRYQQGKPIEIKNKDGNSYRFCDHITTHTMRRTAITTLLLLGVEENIVRTISGHSPGSKEFFKYVANVQNHLNKQVLNAFNRLIIE
jgi:integrase